jgi:ketosteroid isomerase-like protein
MSLTNVEAANDFRAALEAALRTGECEGVLTLLSPDIEWVMPQHTLHKAAEIEEDLKRLQPPPSLDVEFESENWVDYGEGRLSCEVHAAHRSRSTGELAYTRDRTILLTVHEAKIARCEMRFAE